MCGEQYRDNQAHPETAGSSPRVRGTGPLRSRGLVGKGIIPACAGNRPYLTTWISLSRDHPRVCGEQLAREEQDFRELGSSPRVRGTDMDGTLLDLYEGIIPACAGNRESISDKYSVQWDHPRVCGEQSSDAL